MQIATRTCLSLRLPSEVAALVSHLTMPKLQNQIGFRGVALVRFADSTRFRRFLKLMAFRLKPLCQKCQSISELTFLIKIFFSNNRMERSASLAFRNAHPRPSQAIWLAIQAPIHPLCLRCESRRHSQPGRLLRLPKLESLESLLAIKFTNWTSKPE